MDEARSLIRDFKCSRIHTNSSKEEKILCLKLPLTGVLKLNVDGVLFDKIQKTEIGVILRDEIDNVIMAMSIIENGVDSADDIKALAALRTLQLVYQMGVNNIILEGDSMWLVDVEVLRNKLFKTRPFV